MDAIVQQYKQHFDRSLLREGLAWTPEERIVHLQRWLDTIAALRGGRSHGPGLGPVFRALVEVRVNFVLCRETAAAVHGVDDVLMRLDLACRAVDLDLARRALLPFHVRPRGAEATRMQTDLCSIDLLVQPDAGFAQLCASTFEVEAFGVRLRCLTRERLIEALCESSSPRDASLASSLECIE